MLRFALDDGDNGQFWFCCHAIYCHRYSCLSLWDLMFTFSDILFQHNMPKQYTCKRSKPKNIALKYKDKDKVLRENIWLLLVSYLQENTQTRYSYISTFLCKSVTFELLFFLNFKCYFPNFCSSVSSAENLPQDKSPHSSSASHRTVPLRPSGASLSERPSVHKPKTGEVGGFISPLQGMQALSRITKNTDSKPVVFCHS